MKHTSCTLALLGVVACSVDPVADGTEEGTSSADASTGGMSDSGNAPGSTGHHQPADGTTTADASTVGADESGSSGASTGAAEPVCGDGQVSGDEVCDDGINDGSYGSCSSDCTALGPHCGDAQIQGEEACDDGNQTNGDGCNNDCTVSGTVLWSRQLTGNWFNDIALDDEDGVVVVGAGSARAQYYDSDGTPGWSADINEDHAYAVAWHPTEGWLVAGTSGSNGADDVWFRRYDAEGDLQASFDYATGDRDTVSRVAFDGAGNIYATGSTGPLSDKVAWLRKYTNTGAELWSLNVDGGGDEVDAGQALAVNSSDEVIFGGHSSVPGQSYDIWLRRLDSEKNELWTSGYSTSASDTITDVALDGLGGFVIAGAVGFQGVWGARFDDGGLVRTYGDTPDPSVYAGGYGAAVDSAGAVVLVASQFSPTYVAQIRKYDPAGGLLWSRDDAPDDGTSGAYGVVIDSQDAIIVAGFWSEAGGDPDGWVRKYAP